MTQSVLSRQQIIDIATEWDAAWAARDVDRLLAVYTPDATWEDPSVDAPVRGHAALRAFFAGVMAAIPDIDIHQEVLFAEDGRSTCASQWRLTGTITGRLPGSPLSPTGDRADYTGMALITLTGDKISHVRQYPDLVALQRQIGMMPASGSRTERLLMRLQAISARRRMKNNGRTIRLP